MNIPYAHVFTSCELVVVGSIAKELASLKQLGDVCNEETQEHDGKAG
jgi:hypothetical protein